MKATSAATATTATTATTTQATCTFPLATAEASPTTTPMTVAAARPFRCRSIMDRQEGCPWNSSCSPGSVTTGAQSSVERVPPPTHSRPSIARVEPLTRTRAVRGPFDYRLAADHNDVDVGSVLRLPFGGRVMTGVVVTLAHESDVEEERLAEPEAVLPDGLPADLVELALWLADEYCSTPSRALSLMLPPGLPRTTRRRKA